MYIYVKRISRNNVGFIPLRKNIVTRVVFPLFILVTARVCQNESGARIWRICYLLYDVTCVITRPIDHQITGDTLKQTNTKVTPVLNKKYGTYEDVSPENKSAGVENGVEIREKVVDVFVYSDVSEDRQYGIGENTIKEASDWFPFHSKIELHFQNSSAFEDSRFEVI
ncbi:hypothetical protein KUTeg_015575 [Tegillarca granosa]|uniref:Uncharacterized protein n=1 Tax=Tegillarca granosa TaxID=220873 RepID=A0ABQ9EQG5_TEGGR|nr:hypothetical protein KUTeg_015575 [Tegillarca granosa]